MSKCKRCGAEIIWITTVAGKSMPCEAAPTLYREKVGAKDKIVTPDREVLCCEYDPDPDDATGVGYIPHFGNCIQKGGRK